MEDLNIDSNSINPKNTFKEETKEDTKEETKDELIDNKLKEIFYNSFNTESIDKQDNNDGYCVVEKNEVLYEVKGVIFNIFIFIIIFFIIWFSFFALNFRTFKSKMIVNFVICFSLIKFNFLIISFC